MKFKLTTDLPLEQIETYSSWIYCPWGVMNGNGNFGVIGGNREDVIERIFYSEFNFASRKHISKNLFNVPSKHVRAARNSNGLTII